ncbi:MAG: hypothetical protein QME52_07915 [Bacteroidota bacterium]|nr:hypothetical protein [Bacteroidota bacterium]
MTAMKFLKSYFTFIALSFGYISHIIALWELKEKSFYDFLLLIISDIIIVLFLLLIIYRFNKRFSLKLKDFEDIPVDAIIYLNYKKEPDLNKYQCKKVKGFYVIIIFLILLPLGCLLGYEYFGEIGASIIVIVIFIFGILSQIDIND